MPWLLNDSAPVSIGQEFAAAPSEGAWGWFGLPMAGEGTEFAAAATPWTPTYWTPAEIAFNGAEGGGGITAVLARTDAQDTLTSVATVPLAAAFSKTDAADTLASAVAVRVSAAANLTDQTDTLTATAGLRVSVALALTDEADSLIATGTVSGGDISAVFAQTDDADTLQSAAVLAQLIGSGHGRKFDILPPGPLRARLNLRDDDDTLTARAEVRGWVLRVAALALIDQDDALVSAATITWPPVRLARDVALVRELRLLRDVELIRD